ncbi:MAG: hypothetical protein QM763_23970 [Agriterribacter sp.]
MSSVKNKYPLIILYCFAIAFYSCNSLRWSEASSKSLIQVNNYYNFYNDSLQLYIQFYGGHSLGFLKQHMKSYPDSIKKLYKNIKRKLNIKGQIVLVSKQTNRYFGYNYVGFLCDSQRLNNVVGLYLKHISEGDAIFFEGNIFRFKNYYIKPYIIPLRKGDLFLVTMKHISSLQNEIDSTILKENSFHEMMTLKTGEAYMPYTGKAAGIDSIMQIFNKEAYLSAVNKIQNLEANFERSQDSAYYKELLLTSYSFIDEIDYIRSERRSKALEPSLKKIMIQHLTI